MRVEIASEDEDVSSMLVPYDASYRDLFTRYVVQNVHTEKFSRNLNQWIVTNYPMAYLALIINEVQVKNEE